MSYRYHIIILLAVSVSLISSAHAATGDLVLAEKIGQSLSRIESIDNRIYRSTQSKAKIEKNLLAVRRSILGNIAVSYPRVANVWKYVPTYDTTKSYTPHLQKYNLSCELAALSMLLGSI
jgi:hypothetical protein